MVTMVRRGLSTQLRLRGRIQPTSEPNLLFRNQNRFLSALSSPPETTTSSSSSSSTKAVSSTLQESTGLFRLLSPHERSLLQEQRALTVTSRELADRLGLSALRRELFNSTSNNKKSNRPTPAAVLEESSAFCVVVAGEFNAGKSTLINALLGTKLLETGALPTTDTITILSHSVPQQQQPPQQQPHTCNSNILHHAFDLPLLQDLTIVDTPGTNAAVANHTATTVRLLPAADLILFVTSADRPFPDSERQLLKQVAGLLGKSVVIVVNKMDVLDQSGGDHGATEKMRVVDYVTEHASECLSGRPAVIPVSSRDALAAKLTAGAATESSALWRRSNFGALEAFLRDTLTTETKIRAKLSNPVRTAAGLVQQCLDQLQEERTDLETDVATLKMLNSQFTGWQREIQTDMERARTELTVACQGQGERCRVLLRRASGVWQLYQWTVLDPFKLQREWTKTQTTFSQQGLKADLLSMVREMADSIAVRGRAQGQAVIEFLGKRPAVQNQSLVGSVTNASSFQDTRDSLTEHMSEAVRRHVDADEETEGWKVLQGVRQSVWLSLGLNVGALCSALATSLQLVDVLTGVASVSALAAASGFIITTGPRQIAKQHSDLWQSKSRNLNEALKAISLKELDRVDRRIRDGVAPYTRFVESEQERIEELTRECEDVMVESQRLRKRISELEFRD